MRKVFLGRPVHWLLVLLLVGGGAALGQNRLHVIDFNVFIMALLAAIVILLALVLKTSGGDESITRDPLTLHAEDQNSSD